MWLLALSLVADTVHTFSLALSPAESVAVTVTGTGDPVVLVPGLFGSAFGYRAVIPLLTDAGYRAIVVEPLGIGSSARPEHADYSLTAQADRIAAALDRLSVQHAIVVAHSLGASMAFRLAYRRPDLVAGIVSLDGGPAERAATRAFRRAMRLAHWIKLFGGVKLVRRKIRGQLIKASGDSSWVSERVVDGYTAGAAHDLDATLKAFLAMAERREPERLQPHLAEVRCPVRLLLGTATHEGGVSAEEVAVLAAALPAFVVDSVAGAGHFIYEEQPAVVVEAVSYNSPRHDQSPAAVLDPRGRLGRSARAPRRRGRERRPDLPRRSSRHARPRPGADRPAREHTAPCARAATGRDARDPGDRIHLRVPGTGGGQRRARAPRRADSSFQPHRPGPPRAVSADLAPLARGRSRNRYDPSAASSLRPAAEARGTCRRERYGREPHCDQLPPGPGTAGDELHAREATLAVVLRLAVADGRGVPGGRQVVRAASGTLVACL